MSCVPLHPLQQCGLFKYLRLFKRYTSIIQRMKGPHGIKNNKTVMLEEGAGGGTGWTGECGVRLVGWSLTIQLKKRWNRFVGGQKTCFLLRHLMTCKIRVTLRLSYTHMLYILGLCKVNIKNFCSIWGQCWKYLRVSKKQHLAFCLNKETNETCGPCIKLISPCFLQSWQMLTCVCI